jgi:hypothetical protein
MIQYDQIQINFLQINNNHIKQIGIIKYLMKKQILIKNILNLIHHLRQFMI